MKSSASSTRSTPAIPGPRPRELAKANPNLDVSVFREFLVTEQQAAIINARKQGIFQTKHLNVWVGAVRSYFDVRRWKKLADPKLRIENFIGATLRGRGGSVDEARLHGAPWCFKKRQRARTTTTCSCASICRKRR
jgi:phage terminase large subunit-like protein